MSAPTLDIVFFDLDDTLYSTTAFSERARRASVRAMIEHGLQMTEDEALAELMEVVSEFRSNYPHHFGRLLDRVGRRAYPDRNPAVLVAAGVAAYHDAKHGGLSLLPDVREVLETLAKAKVRVGIISAGLQVKQAEKLIRLRALRYVDPTAIFFSDQLGVSKPNPKIFLKACAKAGVEPERALYVGDRPKHDTEAAHHAGLKTVLYLGAGGKHSGEACTIEADYRLGNLRALIPILREDFGFTI